MHFANLEITKITFLRINNKFKRKNMLDLHYFY